MTNCNNILLTSLPDLVNDNKDLNNQSIHTYHLKWIKFKNKECPIITQNENGPCPLLAILNVLLLRANCILENSVNNTPQDFQLDYEQNIHDAISIFPKLQTGLDVNVRFSSITSFEYTSELIVFDLLSISLYHGWIPDKDDLLTFSVVENYSYNQLVDRIIAKKNSDKNEEVNEVLIAENFLKKTASQLTYSGLIQLTSCVIEEELSVLFRNNHFITLYKYQDKLYQLVTDQGFLHEPDVVWLTLSNIDNDDIFLNHEFNPISSNENINEQKNQIDQDYLLACNIDKDQKNELENLKEWTNYKKDLGLIGLSDEELARSLYFVEEHEHDRYLKNKNNSNIGYKEVNSNSYTHSNNLNNKKSNNNNGNFNQNKNKQNCIIL